MYLLCKGFFRNDQLLCFQLSKFIALLIYFKLKASWAYDGLYKELPSDSCYSYGTKAEQGLTELYLKMKKQLKYEKTEAKETLVRASIKNLAEPSNSAKATEATNNTTFPVSEQTVIIKHHNIFTEED